MEKQKFDYEEVLKLGFLRTNVKDKIFEKQNGFEYFIMSLNLGRYSFCWDVLDHTITIYKDTNTFKKNLSESEFNEYIKLLS